MRRLLDRLLAGLCAACALLVCAILLGLVATIWHRGAPALSWNFFTEQIRQVGAQGGIFFNLVGTLILIATAIAICAPIAVGVALLERVYFRSVTARRALTLFLYLLNGLPSIVF